MVTLQVDTAECDSSNKHIPYCETKSHDKLVHSIGLLLKRCEQKRESLIINVRVIEHSSDGGVFPSPRLFDLNAFSKLMREKHPNVQFGTFELILKQTHAAAVPPERTSQEGLNYILANCRKVLLKNQSFKTSLADTPLPAQCAC